MTISELKAFIEGMDIEKAPTEKQWARIAKKLENVHEPLPMRIFDTWPPSPTVAPGTYQPITTLGAGSIQSCN